jgi:hypothetical protein
VRRSSASSGGVRLYGLASARYLFLATALAFDRGALAEAAGLLEKLLPLALRSPAYAVFVSLHRGLLRLAQGQFDGIEDDFERIIQAASSTPRVDLVCAARTLRCRASILLGERPSGPPPDIAPNGSIWGDFLLLWDAIHRARWGAQTFDPSELRSPVPEARILALFCRAWLALSSGDADEARRAAEATAELAASTGHGLLESLARECVTVASLISTVVPSEVVIEDAAALSSLAREMGAAPLVIEAELISLVATPSAWSPGRLEAIAASSQRTPASRRARAILGDPAALDLVDEAFVAAARRRMGARIELLGLGARGAAWGLDQRTQSIWIQNRSFSFADRPLLWRILRVLADAGGAADKEALVIGAWEQRDYHPLRDDARLHTAIRALRRLIEEDPARPQRLVTTESGYALGRDAPVRLLVPSGAEGASSS